MNKRVQRKIIEILKYVLLLAAAFAVLMPVMWFFTSSFRSNSEVFANINPFSFKKMFFGSYSITNYFTIFNKYKIGRSLINTLVVCFFTIVIGNIVCSMAGYALAKMQFKGKNAMFVLVLLAMMIPFDAIAIPLYAIIAKLGWIDTYPAVVFPAVANGMAIFMFRQSFLDLNDSIIEAARIDGCTEFGTFWKIALPICVPSIISGSLVMFTSQWNAFMWPLMVARSDNLRMLQVALTDFQLENGTMWAELFAGITVSMLIPCMILLPFQKYYIRGIGTSGMKE